MRNFTNAENQNIEWKESWRDEYLKWICRFANAQGGKIYIGVRDDGSACGVKDAKRLMEDLPNKIRDTLGLDRIRIANQSVLPDGVTADRLLEDGVSRPTNPKIANAFYRAGFIESWGRGIQEIRDICTSQGMQPPTFEVLPDMVITTFHAETSNNDEQTSIEVRDKVRDKVRDNLTETSQRILELITQNQRITAVIIADTLNISERYAQKQVSLLRTQGYIRRIGARKNGHWEVIEKK